MTIELPIFSSVTYGGHRILLIIEHYLRSFGQSEQCCNREYYHNDKKDVIIDSFILPEVKNKTMIKPERFKFKNYNLDPQRERNENWVCNQEQYDKYRKFYKDKSTNKYVTHNNKYKLEVFEKYLYYHHCDYRKQKLYKRVSNDTYINNGILACANRENFIANKQINSTKQNTDELLIANAKLSVPKKKEDDIHVNGVKKPWIFSLLAYVCYETNICYDPFHVLKNMIAYLFCMLFGRSKLRPSTVQFCKKTASHPTLKKSKEEAKKKTNTKSFLVDDQNAIPAKKIEVWRGIWELNNPMSKKVEIYLQNVLLPSGNTSSLRFKSSVSQFGLVKGKELIEMFECAMDFICWSIQQISSRTREPTQKYPNEYLYFYCMFSSYVSELMAPMIPDNAIDSLYDRAVEIVSVYEGIFPVSETKMIHHQLIDLPHFIKQFGPLRGWWTLPSERSIAQIKREMGGNKGGRNYPKRVYKREYSKEYLRQREIYLNKDNLYQDKQYYFKRNNIEEFTGYKMEVIWNNNPKYKHTKINLSEYECENYLTFLILQTKLIQPDEEKRIQDSPLYRLFISYCYYRNDTTLKYNDGKRAKVENIGLRLFLRNLNNSFLSDELLIGNDGDVDVEEADVKAFSLNAGKKFIRNDLNSIEYYLDIVTTHISVSNKAIIWGTKFTARGEEYRETDKYIIADKRYGAQNDIEQIHDNNLNDLSNNYFIKRVYSSWFKSSGTDNSNKSIFGQLNCFFIIDMKKEPILHNLPVAMVTMRETNKVRILKTNTNQEQYYENLYQSTGLLRKNSHHTFKLMHNIYPTGIVVAPMKKSTLNNSFLPIMKSSRDKPYCYMLFQLNRNHCCLLDNPDILINIKHPYNYSKQNIKSYI